MDSNLNENQIYEEFLYNQKPLLIENNSFNSELESKWNEIEEEKEQKLNKNKKYSKYNNLGDFSIMRINLNSLIHPIDDFSEFEEFCKLKIKKLDKMRNKIDKNNINSNLFNINLDKIKLKSFLKTDNNYFIDNNSHTYNKKKESVIDKNINPKKELKVHKLVEIIDHDINNKSSIINIANCFENFNISKNKSDNNLLMINNLTKKLNKPKKTQSFLKPDDDYSIPDNKNGNLFTSKNENQNSKYKQYFDNNNSFNINNNFSNKYFRYKKNNVEIKSKIEESINYLYNLYPNLKMKKEL
jgi:hypothetical protein